MQNETQKDENKRQDETIDVKLRILEECKIKFNMVTVLNIETDHNAQLNFAREQVKQP